MRSDVTSVGTYWDPLVWDQARGAYISDLDTDPECPDAFIGWLHRSLLEHARRSGAARAELDILAPPRRRDKRGISRTYPMRSDVLETVDRAIIEDRVKLGRVLGRSGFIHEAMVVAIDQARRRRGSPLPTPPSRLPTKPPRRDTRITQPGSLPNRLVRPQTRAQTPAGTPSQMPTADTTDAAATRPPTAPAHPRKDQGRVRRPRPRWYVVEYGASETVDPVDAAVVVLATCASEEAAKKQLGRMRSRSSAGADIIYEVRTAAGIRRRLEWDPDTRRGVERDGPPP